MDTPDSTDPIESLKAVAARTREGEANLRRLLAAVASRLVEACEGLRVFLVSTECVFEEYAPELYVYGHFSFDGRTLEISYRDTDCDITDAGYPPDPYGPRYERKSIDDSPIEWLRQLVAQHSLESLILRIGESLKGQSNDLERCSDGLERIVNSPSLAVVSVFEETAGKLGYSRALEDWKSAQLLVHANPEGAITGACSLVETVARHILADIGEEMPSDQSIQPLVRACARALDLDPATQAEPELRGLCGGIATIAQNIGALRTRFGDAHGKGPEYTSLTTSHARLAVNTAGSAATFLMERWLKRKEDQGAS